MRRARAQRVRSPPILLELPRNSAPRTGDPAAATGDESPARTTLFLSRFPPAAGRSNPSPLLFESAGLLPGWTDARPRCAGIRSASSIPRAAASSPAIIPAAVPLVALVVLSAPSPPASAENQTRLLSWQLQLLPPNRRPSAAAPVSLRRPASSRAKRPALKPPASSGR